MELLRVRFGVTALTLELEELLGEEGPVIVGEDGIDVGGKEVVTAAFEGSSTTTTTTTTTTERTTTSSSSFF